MFNIAGIEWDFITKYQFSIEKGISEYISGSNKCEYTISIYQSDIDYEEKISVGKNMPEYLCFIAIQRKMAEILPHFNSFVLHSAVFDVDGVGVAFAAHSGTGKTTHMLLWQKLLGERMTVVNGDKPIVRFFENEPLPFAYGTPWNGKEHLGCNMRTPLKHICFITRAKENSVVKVEKGDIIDRIFNQIYMPKDPAAMVATMKLIDRLLSVCELWEIRCNMDDDAAKVAYNAIFGNS